MVFPEWGCGLGGRGAGGGRGGGGGKGREFWRMTSEGAKFHVLGFQTASEKVHIEAALPCTIIFPLLDNYKHTLIFFK